MSRKKLKVGMIGCGAISVRHLKAIAEIPEVELYALCDNADDDRVEQRHKDFGGQVLVKDYHELLDDPNIDFVIVTTPDNAHGQITEDFLRAGKHVLLEKPMALQVEDCIRMIQAEKESGSRLMVGQVARYNDCAIKAKEIVESGRIGELVYVESEYAHCYEIHRGYKDWRVNPEREGVIGGGCHAIDLLRYFAGNPEEVHAFSNHKILTDWPVEDSTIAIFKFPGNVLGKVFCSIGAKRRHVMRTTLFGTTGTLEIVSNSPRMTLYESDENGEGYREEKYIEVTPKGHNMEGEIRDFVDAILNDKPTPIKSTEGLYTVTACRATTEAARTGNTVKISYPEV